MLPAAIVLFGVGSAFASNISKQNEKAIVKGYIYDEDHEHCEMTNVDCSTVPSANICSDGLGNQLRELDGTSCSNFLYRP